MPASLRLELDVFVGRRPGIVRDEAVPRLRDARADALQNGELPDRQEHTLVVDELLDTLQQRLALSQIELARLVLEQRVDVRIAAVGEGAARHRERFEAGRRGAEDATEPVDQVLELLLLIGLHESRSLQGSESRLDADRLQIVEDGFGVHARRRVAPEVPRVEALRVSRLREELAGFPLIVDGKRRLPVELEAGGDDAPGDLGVPEV